MMDGKNGKAAQASADTMILTERLRETKSD